MGPWAFGLSLILVSALGLLINAYVLLIIIGLGKQTQQQQTSNTLLLVHLGAVEAAVCLVLLIFTTGAWQHTSSTCVIHGFLLSVLHPVALWTVTGLNCDRYCAIAAPLHYSALVSPRRVTLGLAASWTVALLLCIPPFSGIVPPYKYNPGLGCCVPDFGNDSWGKAATVYGTVYALLGLGLPAILVTICNLRVLGIARYHRHRIASAIYEVTLSAQVTITHQRNPFFVPSVTSPSSTGPSPPTRFRSAATTVMQLVGSLYILYIPYCAFILWEAIGAALIHQQHRLHAHPRLASLASILLASSTTINGLLYGLKSPTLRQSMKNYWRKKVTKSELQQEIQARTPSVAGSRRASGSGPATLSLFPFPPLQRRLSEALINLANSRNVNAAFESGNIATFNRSRLQPAISCNTLRVPSTGSGLEPSSELRVTKVRASASFASLMSSQYRNNDLAIDVSNEDRIRANLTETPSKSPRILITRAYSIGETKNGDSPLMFASSKNRQSGENISSRCQKRRWRHISTGSESSTGSSETSVWTIGIMTPKIARMVNLKTCIESWPTTGKRFERIRNADEAGNYVLEIRETRDNSESSEGTDTTTTFTHSSKIPDTETSEKSDKVEKRRPEAKLRHSESEPTSWSSSDTERESNPKIIERDEPKQIVRGLRRKSGNRATRKKRRGASLESKDSPQQLRPLLTLS